MAIRPANNLKSLNVIVLLMGPGLALITTWILVARYPVPDDDAIVMGLVGFCLMAIPAALLAGILGTSWLVRTFVSPRFNRQEHREAGKQLAKVIGRGGLLASAFGAFSWFIYKFVLSSESASLSFITLVVTLIIPISLWKRRQLRHGSR